MVCLGVDLVSGRDEAIGTGIGIGKEAGIGVGVGAGIGIGKEIEIGTEIEIESIGTHHATETVTAEVDGIAESMIGTGKTPTEGRGVLGGIVLKMRKPHYSQIELYTASISLNEATISCILR